MFSVDLSTRDCGGHVVVELRGELDLVDAAGVAAEVIGWSPTAAIVPPAAAKTPAGLASPAP
jgi:hypothetical protein